MTFWFLFLTLSTGEVKQHPYHFAFKVSCNEMGQVLKRKYNYKKWECKQ